MEELVEETEEAEPDLDLTRFFFFVVPAAAPPPPPPEVSRCRPCRLRNCKELIAHRTSPAELRANCLMLSFDSAFNEALLLSATDTRVNAFTNAVCATGLNLIS